MRQYLRCNEKIFSVAKSKYQKIWLYDSKHDRKHFFSTIYSYRKSTWERYWVNQSSSRIDARGSGGIMLLKVRTMVNRQTRSSRARRVPHPAATKSNRVANYKVHFQVSRLARGVQLENSISATDETSGRRSSRELFSRPWRPPSVIRRDSLARDSFRSIGHVENPVALPVPDLRSVWFPPSQLILNTNVHLVGFSVRNR